MRAFSFSLFKGVYILDDGSSWSVFGWGVSAVFLLVLVDLLSLLPGSFGGVSAHLVVAGFAVRRLF